MKPHEAISAKFETIRQLILQFRPDYSPRPPWDIAWILAEFKQTRIKCPRPKQVLPPSLIDEKTPVYIVAKTFVALEDFEAWCIRALEGQKKQLAENEKQANPEIGRLNMFLLCQKTKIPL